MDNHNLVPDYLKDWQQRGVTYDPNARIDTGIPRLRYKLENGKQIVVGAAGEMMVVTGWQKSRKTLLTSCMMMSHYTDIVNYTLNFELLTDGRPIVFYDTEQPRHRTALNFKRFHELCGKSKHADDLHVFNIKPFSNYEMMNFITHTLDEVMQKAGREPALVVVDQVADLCTGGDVNHIESIGEIYHNICTWQEMTNEQALFSFTIHTNRGGQNTDGRLGKMLDKKCDLQFHCSYDDTTHITEVKHKEARTYRIPAFKFRQNFEGHPQLLGSEADFGI